MVIDFVRFLSYFELLGLHPDIFPPCIKMGLIAATLLRVTLTLLGCIERQVPMYSVKGNMKERPF